MCLEARVDKNQFVLFHAVIHALKDVEVHGNAFSDVCGDDFNKFYKKHELKGTYNKQISAQ